MPIPVYAAERADGLAGAVLSSRRIVLAADVRAAPQFQPPEKVLAHLHSSRATNLGQFDLFYLESVLVTAGWDNDPGRQVPYGLNNNDEFFDPVETWSARATPEDKPFNYLHDCDDVIGHITANRAVDAEGKVVGDDTDADNLPGVYHLVTSCVLYKEAFREKPELHKRMARLVAEIGRGEWRVSMECLFSGFDYFVIEADGSTRAVARNSQTAFLTKHLRAYGGTGVYEGQRVGRLVRNITFSGVGLVRSPANPASVILTTAAEAGKDDPEKKLGYCSVTATNSEIKQENETVMSIELEALQKRTAAQEAEIDRLKAELHQTNVKDITKAKDKAEAEAAELKERLEAAKKNEAAQGEAIKAQVKAIEDAKLAFDGLNARLKAAEAEAAALKGEKAQAERLKFVVQTLNVNVADKAEEEKAAKLVASLAVLPDESFQAHITAMTAWVTNNPQSGNTNFGGGSGKKPEKQTSAQEPPKSTPAPTGDGQQKLSAADLDKAVPTPAPALSTTETDPARENVRKQVAAFYGYKQDEAK